MSKWIKYRVDTLSSPFDQIYLLLRIPDCGHEAGSALSETVWQFCKTLNTESPSDPAISLLGMENWKQVLKYRHQHAHNSKKVETDQTSIKGWMDKLWHTHSMDECPSLKRKELLMRATTWVDPKCIMLSERIYTKSHKWYDSVYVK